MFTPGTRITFQLGTGGPLYTDRTLHTGVVTDFDPTASAPYYVLADDGHKFRLTAAQIVDTDEKMTR